MFITFSGLDGSGKSTLIEILKNEFEQKHRKCVILTMYFHVGVYPAVRFLRDLIYSLRARITGKKVRSELITTDPDRVGLRQARHGRISGKIYRVIRSSFVKRTVYFIDLAIFLIIRLYVEGIGKKTLIMDRYFYDMLADVADGEKWGFIDFFLSILPLPVVPIYVDVPPEVALGRKGEYSLPYLQKRQKKYYRIFEKVKNAFILKNDSMELAKVTMLNEIRKRLV
jgi:thymidylate kinase